MTDHCDHVWVVSVYRYFKEVSPRGRGGSSVAKDLGAYEVKLTHIDIVESDARNAVGLRGTELLCTRCGREQALPWPARRTHASLEGITPHVL
jgi:hypothetical protein